MFILSQVPTYLIIALHNLEIQEFRDMTRMWSKSMQCEWPQWLHQYLCSRPTAWDILLWVSNDMYSQFFLKCCRICWLWTESLSCSGPKQLNLCESGFYDYFWLLIKIAQAVNNMDAINMLGVRQVTRNCIALQQVCLLLTSFYKSCPFIR